MRCGVGWSAGFFALADQKTNHVEEQNGCREVAEGEAHDNRCWRGRQPDKRAAIANGYKIVIANSRAPETLSDLIAEFGPSAVLQQQPMPPLAGLRCYRCPLKLTNNMPVEQLAGKIVLDTNNYLSWRDGHYPVIDSGVKTIHELRQEQLPTSKVAKAFTHIQAPRLFMSAKPAGTPGRHALSVSSNYTEAVELAARLYDQFGFDTVENRYFGSGTKRQIFTTIWRRHVQERAPMALRPLECRT
jgi:hypothetical protein